MSALTFENTKQKESDSLSKNFFNKKEPSLNYKINLDGKCALIQRKKFSNYEDENPHMYEVPSIVNEVLKSPGQPLDKETRAFFESRFKFDLSNVRVHADSKAAESAKSIKANAYTFGHNIVFRAGQYAPTEAHGQFLIAHELTHVMQQQMSENRISAFPPRENKIAELEADKIGQIVLQGKEANSLSQKSPVVIQKASEEGNQSGPEVSKWEKIKWKSVNAMISKLKFAQRSALMSMRAGALFLPKTLKSFSDYAISFSEIITDSIIFFLLGIVGLITGIVYGLVEAIIGLVKFFIGIIKCLLLWFLGLFSSKYRHLYYEYVEGILQAIKNIGPQLKSLFSIKVNEFRTANPEKLSFLIGDLTGEVIAILAQLEIGGGIAGAIPKLQLPMRLPALAYAGARVPTAAAVASFDIASPAIAIAGSGAAMIRIGDSGGEHQTKSEGNISSTKYEAGKKISKSSSTKSSKDKSKKPGKILSEKRIGDVITVKSEVGDSPGRLGLERTLPSNTKLSSKGWERAHSQGNITGAESGEGIRYVPREVNQVYQKLGFEDFVVGLNIQKAPGSKFYLTTETTTHPGTLRLKSITYRIDAEKTGVSFTRIYEAEITISNTTKTPRIGISAEKYGDVEPFLKPIDSR